MAPPTANPQPINVYTQLPRFEEPQEERILPPNDVLLANALRQEIYVLIRSLNDEQSKAQVHQKAAALKHTVDTLKTLEAHDSEQTQHTTEQVIRWEFAYNDHLHDAPPWTANGVDASGPLQSGSVRSPLGQNSAGRNGAD